MNVKKLTCCTFIYSYLLLLQTTRKDSCGSRVNSYKLVTTNTNKKRLTTTASLSIFILGI